MSVPEIRREIKVKTDNLKNKRDKSETERTITFEEIPVENEGITVCNATLTLKGSPKGFKTLEAKGLIGKITDENPPELTMILRLNDGQQKLDTE